MINDMGWTPKSFLNSGHTAMMRCQFRAAIAQFNLYDDVAAAAAQRDQAEAVVDPWAGTVEAPTVPLEVAPDDSEGTAEVVVDPWASTAEASLDHIEVESTSETDLVSSESEDVDAVMVELPESTASCQTFDLSPRGPQASHQGDETPLRGQLSVDPEEIPDSKRRRHRSRLKMLTSPVLRQAASFAADGLFEDYEGVIFKRSASVLGRLASGPVYTAGMASIVGRDKASHRAQNAGLRSDQGAYLCW
jgi:hypothetical protein